MLEIQSHNPTVSGPLLFIFSSFYKRIKKSSPFVGLCDLGNLESEEKDYF